MKPISYLIVLAVLAAGCSPLAGVPSKPAADLAGDEVSISPPVKAGEVEPGEVEPGAGAVDLRECVEVRAYALNVRFGPSDEDVVIGYLSSGDVVEVVAHATLEWWQVRTPGGLTGYVYAYYLAPVDCPARAGGLQDD